MEEEIATITLTYKTFSHGKSFSVRYQLEGELNERMVNYLEKKMKEWKEENT